MKVRLLVKLVGHPGGKHQACAAGDTPDLPEAMAKKLCANGQALSAVDDATHQAYLKAAGDKLAYRMHPHGQPPVVPQVK